MGTFLLSFDSSAESKRAGDAESKRQQRRPVNLRGLAVHLRSVKAPRVRDRSEEDANVAVTRTAAPPAAE